MAKQGSLAETRDPPRAEAAVRVNLERAVSAASVRQDTSIQTGQRCAALVVVLPFTVYSECVSACKSSAESFDRRQENAK